MCFDIRKIILGVAPWKKGLGNADLERWQWHKNIFSVATKTNDAKVYAKTSILQKLLQRNQDNL